MNPKATRICCYFQDLKVNCCIEDPRNRGPCCCL
jgi:hypothetical protein